MIEILEFAFTDFWHWLGFAIIVAIPFNAIVQIFKYINQIRYIKFLEDKNKRDL